MKRIGQALGAAALAVAGIAAPGHAQEAVVADVADGVDPAKIAVPDLRFVPTKEDAERFYKFFYFHKAGVAFAEAARDLAECEGYGDLDFMYVDIPKFVPYALPDERRSSARQFESASSSYGLAGSLMVSVITDGLLDKVKIGNRILCMHYKGYRRYGLTRALSQEINKGEPREVILRNAKIASGPAPAAEGLWP